MKKLLLCLSLCLCISGIQAESKIAVVDLQKVLQNIPELKSADATFKQEFTQRQAALTTQAQQLEQAQAAYKKQAATLTPEQKAKAESTLQKQSDDLQTAQAQYATDFQSTQAKLMQSLFSRIKAAVNRVATAEGYDMVLPKASAIYFKPNADITQKVIVQLNAKP